MAEIKNNGRMKAWTTETLSGALTDDQTTERIEITFKSEKWLLNINKKHSSTAVTIRLPPHLHLLEF